jgi:hypothetical protein
MLRVPSLTAKLTCSRTNRLENRPFEHTCRDRTQPVLSDYTLVNTSHALGSLDTTLVNPNVSLVVQHTPPLSQLAPGLRALPCRPKKSLVHFPTPAPKLAAPRLFSDRPQIYIAETVDKSQLQKRLHPEVLCICLEKDRKLSGAKPQRACHLKRKQNKPSVSPRVHVFTLS